MGARRVAGVTHSADASTLTDTAVDIGATSEVCQMGIERVNGFAIEGMLNDNVVTVTTAVASVNNGTISGSTDYFIGADHIDACVVGSALGCHGRTIIIEGLRNTVAVGVFLHRPLPEVTACAGSRIGRIATHSQLVADTGYLVIGSGRNRINGRVVDLATNGMLTEHSTGIVLADTTVGGYCRGRTHAIGGVLRGAGVVAYIDTCQTQNVIGSKPAGAIACATRRRGVGHIECFAVRGNLGDDDLILEGVDVVAGSLSGEGGIGVAVDLGCAGQGHGIGHEGQPVGHGGGHRRRGGSGCFNAEERDSPEAQH